jgi:hypothetical protein
VLWGPCSQRPRPRAIVASPDPCLQVSSFSSSFHVHCSWHQERIWRAVRLHGQIPVCVLPGSHTRRAALFLSQTYGIYSS